MKRAEWAEWRFALSPDRRRRVATVLGGAVDRRMVGVPELLGSATIEMVREQAGEWGVSFSTLYRLLRAKSPSVSWKTLLRIQKHLNPSELEALEAAAFPPAVRRAFTSWQDYVRGELDRASGGTGREASDNIDTADIPAAERSLKKRFDSQVQDKGLPENRARLAYYRVYDALVPWRKLGRSMPAAARLRILKLGWRREDALLIEEVRLLRKTTVVE